MAKDVGSGETTYSNYDKKIVEDAKNWILKRKKVIKSPGFFLFPLFVLTSFPLIAPEEFYNLYPEEKMPLAYAS